jgi:hypothetical protein
MVVVPLLFGSGLALVFIVVFWRSFLRSAASRHWRQVPGTVRAVVIEQHMRTGGADRFSARVDYDYVFEGRQLRSSEPIGGSYVDRDVAVNSGRAYTAGQQVLVAVDPARPRNSTLRPGLKPGNLVPLLFGVGMLVFFLTRLFADAP